MITIPDLQVRALRHRGIKKRAKGHMQLGSGGTRGPRHGVVLCCHVVRVGTHREQAVGLVSGRGPDRDKGTASAAS